MFFFNTVTKSSQGNFYYTKQMALRSVLGTAGLHLPPSRDYLGHIFQFLPCRWNERLALFLWVPPAPPVKCGTLVLVLFF